MKKCMALLLACLMLLSLTFCAEPENPQPSDKDGAEEPSQSTQNKEEAWEIPLYLNESMPVIRIETEGGSKIPTDKSDLACSVSLECDKKNDCQESLGAVIRVRGNGSLAVAHSTGKYPYKIKFDSPINLFSLGDGEARDWVLLSHGGEHTMLRDWAAKTLGDMLEGIDYSPNSRLVSVYLNGAYIGVYELTEQIEVKYCRVAIDDTLKIADNGFLVELDSYAGENSVHVGGRDYSIKSTIRNEKQITFIEEYLQQVHDAIQSGNLAKINELVDLDSLVDMYLLQEFSKNIDVGWSSFYMYRASGGKLHFGPPWDFDLAFGNDERLDNGSHEGLYVGTGREGYIQNHEWYIKLYEYQWFRTLVADRWAEISDTHIPRLIEAVRAMGASVGVQMNANYRRWAFLGKRLHEEPPQIVELKTYSEHVRYLVDWMTARKAWLDLEFGT